MRKITRSISVFFLWLAWLLLIAHQIIPHDHHQPESVAGMDESCPLSGNKSDHHNGFPVHCHALNDLTSEKVTVIILKNAIPDNDLTFTEYNDVFDFDYITNGINIFEIRRIIPDSHILELSCLRAPPSLS